jgi:hypothetical protein
MMEHKTISQQERQILIGALAGKLIFAVVPVLVILYFVLFQTIQTVTLIVALLVSFIVIISLLPRILKLVSDLSSGVVLEGVDEITHQTMSTASAFSQYIGLKGFEKKKIQIQYKDYQKMTIGKKIRYRVSPKTMMLVSFELLS